MRVLLIQPPYTILKKETKSCHPPLGLAYLAAALKDNHKVGILDTIAEGFYTERAERNGNITYGLGFDAIKDKIRAFRPDAIGVSCLFSAQAKNAHRIFALAKEVDPRIKTITGGAHPSAMPELMLTDINLDYVVLGEGDRTISDLLGRIEKNENLEHVEGIAYRYNDKFTICYRKELENNLDNLPMPAWEYFPLERYFSINRPHGGTARNGYALPMITSRGCPFHCIFCSIHTIWGKRYRRRSPVSVLGEIDYLVSKFNIKELIFDDDNLTFDRNRSIDIFSGMIDKKFDLAWFLPNGVFVETLDRELLGLMKKSGCYSISLAVESGDEEILAKIRKPIKLSNVKKVVAMAKELGFEVSVFFVVGFPFETRRQVEKTINFARQLKVDNVNFFYATPLPGSELFNFCIDNNLLGRDPDFGSFKTNEPSLNPSDFKKEELKSLIEKERLKLHIYSIYRHPLRFLSKLKRKILKEPEYFFKFIYNLFKSSARRNQGLHKKEDTLRLDN